MFCVVPLSLWPQHTDIRTTPYIDQQLLPDPGPQPVYPFGSPSTQIQVLKDVWLYDAKNWLEVRNMNKALTKVLMKLLQRNHYRIQQGPPQRPYQTLWHHASVFLHNARRRQPHPEISQLYGHVGHVGRILLRDASQTH